MRYHRGEVCTGTVAAHAHSARVGTQLLGVGHRPPIRGIGIVQPSRSGMLRSEPVIDRQHLDPSTAAYQPAQSIMSIQIAEDPAAPVIKHYQRSAANLLG